MKLHDLKDRGTAEAVKETPYTALCACQKRESNMNRPAKRTNGKYVHAGYEDKVIFELKKKRRRLPAVLAAWKKSQGLWRDHPVFKDMTVKEVIEWLRGEDCDV